MIKQCFLSVVISVVTPSLSYATEVLTKNNQSDKAEKAVAASTKQDTALEKALKVKLDLSEHTQNLFDNLKKSAKTNPSSKDVVGD